MTNIWLLLIAILGMALDVWGQGIQGLVWMDGYVVTVDRKPKASIDHLPPFEGDWFFEAMPPVGVTEVRGFYDYLYCSPPQVSQGRLLFQSMNVADPLELRHKHDDKGAFIGTDFLLNDSVIGFVDAKMIRAAMENHERLPWHLVPIDIDEIPMARAHLFKARFLAIPLAKAPWTVCDGTLERMTYWVPMMEGDAWEYLGTFFIR